jgi:hypothetical protein
MPKLQSASRITIHPNPSHWIVPPASHNNPETFRWPITKPILRSSAWLRHIASFRHTHSHVICIVISLEVSWASSTGEATQSPSWQPSLFSEKGQLRQKHLNRYPRHLIPYRCKRTPPSEPSISSGCLFTLVSLRGPLLPTPSINPTNFPATIFIRHNLPPVHLPGSSLPNRYHPPTVGAHWSP